MPGSIDGRRTAKSTLGSEHVDSQDAFRDLVEKTSGQESVANLLTLCESDTVRICRAVESLDKFYYQELAEGKLAVVYSLLCEFAHPNHRGVLDFMQSVKGDGGG